MGLFAYNSSQQKLIGGCREQNTSFKQICVKTKHKMLHRPVSLTWRSASNATENEKVTGHAPLCSTASLRWQFPREYWAADLQRSGETEARVARTRTHTDPRFSGGDSPKRDRPKTNDWRELQSHDSYCQIYQHISFILFFPYFQERKTYKL